MTDIPLALPRRVLVEIRPGADVRLVAAHASRLARIFGSEIKGVFVEDTDLMELAGLAAAIEVGLISRRPRRLDPDALALEMRRSLAAARRAFAALAGSLPREVELEVARQSAAGLPWQFRPDDLLLLSGALEQMFEAASSARAAAARAVGIAFPAARTPAWQGAVRAILHSDEARRRVEALLDRIAAAEQTELEVTVSDEPLAALLRLVELAEPYRPGMAARLPRMIVGETHLLDEAAGRPLRTLMRKLGCPVLLLNPEGPAEREGPNG